MSINAGTVMAYMDMDLSKFETAMQTALSEAAEFSQEGSGISGVLDGIGYSATAAGTALTLGVTTPLLAVGTAAVMTGLKFDESMSTVAALSGTTGEKFDQLRDKALEMGSTTKYTASQAADAMGYMALAGWNADQMMAGLPGVLSLAAAANMDLARASDIVTDTMTPFGLAAEEAGRVSDVFAKKQATSNTNVEQLGEAMKYAASNADAFGMSIEQTAAVMGLFANSGVKGSMAGTTMTSMLTDMKNAMVDGAIAIGNTNVSMVDAQGNYREFPDIFADIEAATAGMSESQRDAALSAVFQTRGLKGVLALLKQGSGALYDYTDALENADGAADQMAATMIDNLKGDLTILQSGIEGAAIALSDFLVPALRKGVQWVTNAVGWFNGLDASIKNTVFRVGTIAAAIGPALLAGGKLITAFSGVLPIAGLLAAGFALVYGHSEKLQAFVETTRESIPEWIDGIRGGYEAFTAALQNGQGVIDAAQSGLEAAFGSKAATAVGRTLRAVTAGFRTAKGTIDNAANGLGEFFGSLIDGESTANALRSALEAAFGSDFAISAEGAITRIDNALNAVKATAETFAAGTRVTLSTLWDGIGQDFETGGLMGVLTGLGGRLLEALQSGAELAREGAATVRERIAEGLSMARAWLDPKVQGWMGNLGSAYQEAVSYATDKMPTIKDAILTALTAAKETVTAKAQDVMTWLGDAYRSDAVQSYLGDLSGVATTIWGKIQLAKTTLTDKAAEWLNELGTTMGSEEVKAKVSQITSVAATLAGKIVSGAGAWKLTATTLIGDLIAQLTDNGFLETAVTGLGSIVTEIAKGIGAAAESITGCASTLISTLTDKFSETGFIESTFTTAADVVLSIGTALANSAGNMADAATKLAMGLIQGFTTLNWGTIFSRAGEIVGSIAKVLSDNAGAIGSAALDLGLTLLEGLAAVDWATISYNLGVALGNMVSAISDWFSVPGNTQKLTEAIAQIVGGAFSGSWSLFWDTYDSMVGGPSTWQQITVTPPVIVDPTVTVDADSLQTKTNNAVTTGSGGKDFTIDVPMTVDPDATIDTAALQKSIDDSATTLTNGEAAVTVAAQGVANAIKTPFEGLPEETKAQAALMLASVNTAITEGTPEATLAIETAATAVLNKAKEILSAGAGMVIGVGFIAGMMTGAIATQGALTAVIHNVGALGVSAMAAVMSSGAGFGIGQSMIQAVIDGAGSMGSALAGRMYNLASSAVSAFKSAIRMASPPRAFVEIGEAIPDAVGLGTDYNRDAALNPITDLANDMVNAFNVTPDGTDMTQNPHSVSVDSGETGNGGRVFNFQFYGDMTVRDDSDIERISRQIYDDILTDLRGGGAFA